MEPNLRAPGLSVVPIYDYRCHAHGLFEEVHPMDDAARATPCPVPGCGRYCARTYVEPPNFTEDKTRHKDYSRILGQGESPQSRGDLKRIEKEKGIYFTNTLTEKEKTLKQYAQHVRQGGERVDAATINPPEKVQSKTVQQLLREKNVKLKP